jgi:hypothetical protein
VERRSGEPAVDRVLDALMSGDIASLQSVVAYVPKPCVAPFAVTGRPPFCAPGEPEGTIVTWFMTGGTEGFHYREGAPLPTDLFASLAAQQLRLVAVYEAPAESEGARWIIVTTPTRGSAAAPGLPEDEVSAPRLWVNEDGMIALLTGIERRASVLPAGPRYLVPARTP